VRNSRSPGTPSNRSTPPPTSRSSSPHGRIFDPDHDREWFAWKCADNPYVDHRPVLVAREGDDLVGARPSFALDVFVDGQRHLALQPGDTMARPDHRRQGLFTRMTEAAIERYADGEPSFFVNFPNGQSGPSYRKLGWGRVREESTYYRVQGASAVGLGGDGGAASALSRLAGGVAQPLLAGYNRLRAARLGSGSGSSDVTVTRHEDVPASTLAGIDSEPAPGGIHVARDEQFYEWRFGNPEWEYTAYVAEHRATPSPAWSSAPRSAAGKRPRKWPTSRRSRRNWTTGSSKPCSPGSSPTTPTRTCLPHPRFSPGRRCARPASTATTAPAVPAGQPDHARRPDAHRRLDARRRRPHRRGQLAARLRRTRHELDGETRRQNSAPAGSRLTSFAVRRFRESHSLAALVPNRATPRGSLRSPLAILAVLAHVAALVRSEPRSQ
jgi:GNAT superfamily N-acetyltransferase